MSIRFHTARDYEAYFKTLKNADWQKQYLTSDGELRSKCCCSIFSIFLRILKISCIRLLVSPNMYQARELIRGRITAYYTLHGKTKDNLDCVVGACKKVNDLINKINGRRPDNGLKPLPDELRFNIDKYETSEAPYSASVGIPTLYGSQLAAPWGMSSSLVASSGASQIESDVAPGATPQ